jgi:hypothetical protein
MGDYAEFAVDACGVCRYRQHQMPVLLRYVLSPGDVLVLHAPPTYGSLGETIARSVLATLATDAVYYSLILWFAFKLFHRTHSNANSERKSSARGSNIA